MDHQHNRYALYHPSAEAISSMVVDMPYKITNSLVVNSTLYCKWRPWIAHVICTDSLKLVMANLRREPGAFFFFLLVAFTMTLSMSMFFRLFASITKTIEQALAPSSIILLLLVLYTGFAIPVHYMRGYVLPGLNPTFANICRWASWVRWLNPVSYGFESVMVNEFHGRQFECSTFIPSGPSYENVAAEQRACAVQGAQPGSNFVGGTAYVETAYRYYYGNRWRNYGLIIVFTLALLGAHLVMSELVASERSKGEVLVFRRSKMKAKGKRKTTDEESGTASVHGGEKFDSSDRSEHNVQKQVSIFHWEKVNYEVQIKDENRVILDSVDGWIKPGTLTALMVGGYRM
jgi:ATP-binding cassette subfamily G (WHITE) protein 2 (PDR)